MIKVTIETEGVVCEIKQEEALTLDDLLQLVEQAIKGVGYYPPENTTLDYIENETPVDPVSE